MMIVTDESRLATRPPQERSCERPDARSPPGEALGALPSMKAFAFLKAVAHAQRPLSVSEFSAS